MLYTILTQHFVVDLRLPLKRAINTPEALHKCQQEIEVLIKAERVVKKNELVLGVSRMSVQGRVRRNARRRDAREKLIMKREKERVKMQDRNIFSTHRKVQTTE